MLRGAARPHYRGAGERGRTARTLPASTSGKPAIAATCPKHPWRCSTPTAILDPSPRSTAATRHRGSPQSPPPRGALSLR
jgi:hypothetical protein